MAQYALKSKFDIPKASKTEDIAGLKAWVMSTFEGFRSQILAELKMIERTAQGSTSATVSATSSAAISGGGSGGLVTTTDEPAQSVDITTVVDTNIPFVTPVPTSYIVEAFFYASDGSPSIVWIDQENDCYATYFIVRVSQIPGPGKLYYRVKRKA